MLTIRPIALQDKSSWAALWHDYLEFYETTLPQETYDLTFARLCDPARTQQCGFIALKDGEAVGIVHYIFHDHNWREEQVCYLQDLFAAPDVRGTGVGRKLIEAVYDAADTAGTPAVYWLTQHFNATARQLYDRIGTLSPFIKYNRS